MANPFESVYQQAADSGIVIHHPSTGVLRLTGEDRLPFLHRMSTNDIEGMVHGTVRSTTLTTPLARIIDRLWLVNFEDELLVLTSPDRGEAVQAWLNKHIFFNDNVHVANSSGRWSLWGAYGPAALSQIAELFNPDTAPRPSQVVKIPGGLLLGWKAPAGLRLLLSPESESKAAARWPDAFASVTADVFETLRVEAGQPIFGGEFDEDSIPLEVGLRPTVNFDKGCYTGQEIIARMDSRGQLARRLVGFRLPAQCQPGVLVTEAGQTAGKLTSCADSPRLGWIGLGVVRTQYIEPKTYLTLASSGQQVELMELPFGEPH